MGPSREKAAALAAEQEDPEKAKRSDGEKQDISMILINSIVFDSRLGIYLNKFTWIFVQYHSEDEKNFSGNKRNLPAIASDGNERKASKEEESFVNEYNFNNSPLLLNLLKHIWLIANIVITAQEIISVNEIQKQKR